MRRAVRLSLISLLALFLLTAGGVVWLTMSESGLQTALRLVSAFSGERLESVGASGRLAGPLAIEKLRWADGDLRIEIEQLRLDWSPVALWENRLQIDRVACAKLAIISQPSATPPTPPPSLLLPLAVAIDDLAIARIDYNALITLSEVSGRLTSDGRQHRLDAWRAVSGDSVLQAAATVDGAAPPALTAQGEIASRLAGQPVALRFAVSGPLEKMALRVDGKTGVAGYAEAQLTPFAATPFASATVAVEALDPADWQSGAPSARLDLRAELTPTDSGVAGPFTLTNRRAGPLDQQRLPLASLAGKLDWRGERLGLTDLAADLGGGGRLAGQGRWQDQRLTLDLNVTALDAARLASMLRQTRLNGALRAAIGSERQDIAATLKDAQYSLNLSASHSGNRFELRQLELSRDQAKLAATGQLALDGQRTFAVSGEISRFDPSLFARLPRGRIDAKFAAHGALQPQLQIDASFHLADSRIKGQRLSGQGQVNIAWPHVRQADIELFAGVNSLRAAGAFGRPGDRLTLTLAAPQLEPFGLEGGLDGHLELSGDRDNPTLQFDLRSPLLGRSNPGACNKSPSPLAGEGLGRGGEPLPPPPSPPAPLPRGERGDKAERDARAKASPAPGGFAPHGSPVQAEESSPWRNPALAPPEERDASPVSAIFCHAPFGRLRDLTLTGKISRAPDAPLRLALSLGRFDDAGLTPQLRQLQINIDGSWRAHRLQAAAELPAQLSTQPSAARHLELTAAGGLEGEITSPTPRWRGQLLTAQSSGVDASRNIRLLAPADLSLAAAAWSFGPAQLAGEPLDWRATVAAAAQPRALRLDIDASGSRLGKLSARLDAGLLNAWTLDRQAPWQGRLDAAINDLGWLGDLLGAGWQSGGGLQGQLELAGSPAAPTASGRLQGERLLLRQTKQGLHLANGELLLELDRRLLRLRRLTFDSLLQPMPRALRNSSGELAALVSQPGRLQASGELAFDPAGGQPQGALDLRLERFGAMQLAEQWLLLSGDGRLDWNGERIGIRGKLTADAGYWQLAPAGLPKLSDDVVVRQSGQVDNSWRPQIDLDLSGDLGRNFLFSGAGLVSRLAGEVRLTASGRDLPRASGVVRLRDGRFDAYGQQLAISRGQLTFQGLLDNPALDVLAVRQGLAVEPGVQISGTAQRPVIRLVSTPELPDAEKLSWLILGHGPDAVGSSDAGLLLVAAGGLLGNDAGKLTGQLKDLFGIDVFTVRQGELGGDNRRPYGSRLDSNRIDTTAATGNQILSIGKRLSSNAMLSYEQVLGGAEGIVKLTIDLSRQIALVGRAGSDNAVDIFYTVAFGRPPRQPAPVVKKGE